LPTLSNKSRVLSTGQYTDEQEDTVDSHAYGGEGVLEKMREDAVKTPEYFVDFCPSRGWRRRPIWASVRTRWTR
jgi:hypothetical protein